MSEPNTKFINTRATIYRINGESETCRSSCHCSMVLTWGTSTFHRGHGTATLLLPVGMVLTSAHNE